MRYIFNLFAQNTEYSYKCCFKAVDLLAKLSVDGQDLRVADESKGQNGDGVCSLLNRQGCFSAF